MDININIPALDRLADAVMALAAAGGAVPAAKAETKPKPAPTEKPAGPKPTPGEKAVTEQPKLTADAGNENAEALADRVKTVAMQLAQKVSRDELIATLKKFGATNITGLAVDKQQAFIDECQGKIEAAA